MQLSNIKTIFKAERNTITEIPNGNLELCKLYIEKAWEQGIQLFKNCLANLISRIPYYEKEEERWSEKPWANPLQGSILRRKLFPDGWAANRLPAVDIFQSRGNNSNAVGGGEDNIT